MRRHHLFFGAICAASTAFLATIAQGAAQEFIDRPELRPGLILLWHSTLGDSAETFIGYVEDPSCPKTPCSRWLGTSWRGPTYFLEDADLNRYSGTTADGLPVVTPYAKRLSFPIASNKHWESRFRNAAGWEIQQSVTVIGWESLRIGGKSREALHLHEVNHRLNGSPYLGSAAWFAQDYFVSISQPEN